MYKQTHIIVWHFCNYDSYCIVLASHCKEKTHRHYQKKKKACPLHQARHNSTTTQTPQFNTHLHADVAGEDGRYRPEHKSDRRERALDPRVLPHAHKEKHHGPEDYDEDAADRVLRRQEGIRAMTNRLVDLQKQGLARGGVGGYIIRPQIEREGAGECKTAGTRDWRVWGLRS